MTTGTPEVTLLPCPFCGGDELSHGWSSPGYDGSMHSGSAECHSCGALIIAETEAEAITAWNTRATTADLQARLEEAEGREIFLSRDVFDALQKLSAAEGRIAGLVEGVGKHVEMLRHGYAPFVERALSEAMCCSGQMCGCRGASVGEYLAELLLQDTGLTLATRP